MSEPQEVAQAEPVAAKLEPGWYLSTDGKTKRWWNGDIWTDHKQTPPGWYPHPTMAGTQQYWDGEKWTENVAPLPLATAQAAPGRTANGMSVSYVRPQQGHSLIANLVFGIFILWINVIYISLSPNHYWHA